MKTIINNPTHLKRQFTMFLPMIYISSIWTLMAYYKNFRNVEVEVRNKDGEYVVKPHCKYDAFFILGYDVIFEIGVAYLTFYRLPHDHLPSPPLKDRLLKEEAFLTSLF